MEPEMVDHCSSQMKTDAAAADADKLVPNREGVDLCDRDPEAKDDQYELRPLLRGFRSWPALDPTKATVLGNSATFNALSEDQSSKSSGHQGEGMNKRDVNLKEDLQSSSTQCKVDRSSPEVKVKNHFGMTEGHSPLCNHASNASPAGNDNCHTSDQHQSSSVDLIDKVRTILCRGSLGVEMEWDSSLILSRGNLFTQLDILCHSQNGNSGWKQMARYLMYEEKVELGGRWSKPHVSTASLHALLQIRQSITDASCVLEMEARPRTSSLDGLAETITEAIAEQRKLDKFVLTNLSQILSRPHKHKNRHGRKDTKPKDKTSKEFPEGSFHKPRGGAGAGPGGGGPGGGGGGGSMQRRKSLVRRDGKDYWAIYTTYHQGIDPDHLWPYAPNKKLMRKIPVGAEGAIVMIGQMDFLEDPLIVFVRLQSSQLIDELLEVAIPTRFIVLAFGPSKNSTIAEFFDIGRAFAAILNDKVFCEVAYKASCAQDLLDGLDEFLDDLTVLPPSIWDPTTRLEPPQSTRSADKIWKRLNEATRYINSAPECSVLHEDIDDESLMRTGRIFGGLISDCGNRYRYFISDFTDGCHLQCFASVIFLYFACITPIVTFGGLMGQKTDNYMGTMETLMSGAICGVLYALFSGQPLNIIGSTGPLLVFESILYHLCKEKAIEFLSFRFWIGIWVFFYLLLIVAFDLSSFVRYITRFTEESFAVLISVIFIYEACSKITEIWTTHPVMRSRAELRSRFDCFCSSPHLPRNPDANDSLLESVTPSDLRSLDRDLQTLPTGNSTSLSDDLWSSGFPEDCLTFRHRLVVGYGCSSASECTDRGWVLTGSSCQDEEVLQSVPDVFLLSCILFFGTFSAAMFFRTLRNTPYFPTQVRTLVSDFAVFLAVITWSWVDFWFSLDTPKLDVPNEFKPTLPDRGWFVSPIPRPSWWLIPAAALPGALATILVFLDQQITAVIVNRKEHKLKKGHGYHLDLLVLAFLIAICSAMGLPWFVAATVRAITHVRSLIRESEVKAPGERPQMLGVREQRLTGICIHLLIGLSSLLTSVLRHIPMPVLYGVFLYMGVTSLAGVQFIERILIMFMPVKYQPDYIYLRHVQTSRVHYFTIIQVACSALMWIIKSVPVTSIAFPLMLVGLVVARKGMDFIFTQRDLYWLDNLLPDETRRRFEDFTAKFSASSQSPTRGRMSLPNAHHASPPASNATAAAAAAQMPELRCRQRGGPNDGLIDSTQNDNSSPSSVKQ